MSKHARVRDDSDNVSDVPLAVLIGRDGSERTWTLQVLPPPGEILIPRSRHATVEVDTAARTNPLEHRRFRLSASLRSRSHRWFNVYNDRRSRTPEDGFVYLEVEG